jgi:hypothetical protein
VFKTRLNRRKQDDLPQILSKNFTDRDQLRHFSPVKSKNSRILPNPNFSFLEKFFVYLPNLGEPCPWNFSRRLRRSSCFCSFSKISLFLGLKWKTHFSDDSFSKNQFFGHFTDCLVSLRVWNPKFLSDHPKTKKMSKNQREWSPLISILANSSQIWHFFWWFFVANFIFGISQKLTWVCQKLQKRWSSLVFHQSSLIFTNLHSSSLIFPLKSALILY